MEKIILLPTKSVYEIWPNNEDYNYFEESGKYPFEYSSQVFEPVNAWRLADSAFVAYTPESFAQLQFTKLGLDKFQSFFGDSTQCYVASNDNFAIITFRGTEIQDFSGLQDFIIDVRFNLVESSVEGKIHNGFKDALDVVWSGNSNLSEYLKQLRVDYPTIKLWFTGHSLGAALAILAAGRWGHAQGLYTYGCPKVGNSIFVNAFPIKTNFYQFVNSNDLISDLPFTDPIISPTTTDDIPWFRELDLPSIPMPTLKFPEQYQCIGTSIYFDRHGNLTNRSNPLDTFFERMIEVANSLASSAFDIIQFKPANFPISLTNHAPIHYAINTRNYLIDSQT